MNGNGSASAQRARRLQPTASSAPATLEWGRWAVSLGGLGLVAFALWFGWVAGQRSAPPLGQPPDRARTLGPFELTERSGRTVQRAELTGQICVVSFVYTSCGVTCLQVTRNLSRFQALVENQPDVRIVSLSVDPVSDTPPVLSKFAHQFGAQPERWWFLTGEAKVLSHLIEESFLQRGPRMNNDPMPGGFLGTTRVALVDRHGQVRGFFDGLDRHTPEALVRAIEQLRKEIHR
ncbi:MAG: SCO family protein [Verrucomicrobia bacterium]|nr:SCO family protein [Verrucomicrobiota bacterium]